MLYILYTDSFGIRFSSGVGRKIMGQIRAFKKAFGRVYYTYYSGSMMYLFDGDKVIDKEIAVTKQACNAVICTWLDKYRIKRTYIRYAFADKWFIHFLKYQKEKNIRSILEIPTYPYDGEEIAYGRVKIEDQYYREQIHQYMDVVATNSCEDNIWGMRCILLMNGIDPDDYTLRVKRSDKNEIVMIGVSTLLFWQGYERVIQGLYNYYKEGNNGKVSFKIVGEGPEKAAYYSLVEKYRLQCQVEFCGWLDGRDLDRQYDLSDIAVSSLGRYKSGVYDITPVKGAEYCMRGIPFLCGYHDLRFTGDEGFILNVPNNSEAIDINQVIEFYKMNVSQEGYEEKMRKYALKNLTWDTILRPIIDILK